MNHLPGSVLPAGVEGSLAPTKQVEDGVPEAVVGKHDNKIDSKPGERKIGPFAAGVYPIRIK